MDEKSACNTCIPVMNPAIVIPTYNERENIRILIPQIVEFFQQNGLSNEGKILVVDDNSQDGTAEVVNEFMKRYKNVFVEQECKRRIGVGMLQDSSMQWTN